METLVERDYPYHAAGRVWRVPEVRLTRLPDGTVGISQAEIDRIHRAIANRVCGGGGRLTFDELDFLCDVTGTRLTEVAARLGVHKSTVSKWRGAGIVGGEVGSLALKRWFWFKLFGGHLGGEPVRLDELRDDAAFLDIASRRAIAIRAADEVEPART